MAETKTEFIFRENEFEVANFSASNFISKYRRIDSLESIKEQLQLYCKGLKQELYDIINRDYAEFITIATKLDGVDSRIDHLRKPLINLRLDLASLQDNIVVSVKTIQLKLKQKENIHNRRNAIKASLDCMMHVDVADSIINNSSDDNTDKNKSRRDLLHVLKKSKASQNGTCVDKEVFNCSELERAAYAILNATNCLNVMKKSNVVENGSATSSGSTTSLIRNLEQRVVKLSELLIIKLKSQLTSIFSNTEKYITSIELSNTIKSDNSHLLTFPVRQYTHCLRALIVLGKGDIIENIIAELLVVPHIKSALTQGRIDGSSGRGTFAGLTEALENVLKVIRSLLLSVFNATENVIAGTNSTVIPLDVIINSVWKPIMALLSERFPIMFSTAIANTFKHCYNAYEKFNQSITDVAGVEWKDVVSRRMKSNETVKLYNEKWKFDLYYRIRMQEISGRLDKSCVLAYQHGLMYNSYALIYKNPSDDSKQGSAFSATEIQDMTNKFQLVVFHLPIFNVFCMEMCTCMHDNTTLKPLDMKFFKLSITIINRLEVQLAMLLDIPTTLLTKADIANLQTIAANEVLALINAANKEKDTSTPAKKSAAGTKEPVTNTTPPPLPTISSDELVLLAVDLYHYEEWMKDAYFKNVYMHLTRYQAAETQQELSVYSVIKESILFQCNKLQYIRENIWSKICNIISGECKRGLNNVKAIAGRYRMTNKPPPETASTYVASILAPYKTFVEKNKEMISAFAPTEAWSPAVVNEINASYLLQIQSLMETVVQMETDIKRRLKVTTTATTTMTDSEKIALQLRLDIKAYGSELEALGLSTEGMKTLQDAIVNN